MQYTETQLEKAAFYGLCKHYDFLHEYSDDHSAWKKGEAQWAAIQKAVTDTPEYRPILQAWAEYWAAYCNNVRPLPAEPNLQSFI